MTDQAVSPTIRVLLVDEDSRIVTTLDMPVERTGCAIILHEGKHYTYLQNTRPAQFMEAAIWEA